MNGKRAKAIRKRAQEISGRSWREVRHMLSGLPHNHAMPPADAGFHNIKVGNDKEGKPLYFPVVNPIKLDKACGRAHVRLLKRISKKFRMKVIPEKGREHVANVQ